MTTNPTYSPEMIRTALCACAADHDRAEKALRAQLAFDFDATWEALPPPSDPAPVVRMKGAAGHRLQDHLKTTWPEPLLTEFARDTLGAVRIRSGYLDALRVVLGNQAHAERHGYTLEQNIRVDFATERVMRTINEQMHAACITRDRVVHLGGGRVQTVQCFVPERRRRRKAEDLCSVLRREEDAAEAMRREQPPKATIPAGLAAEDVPY